jgi:hypothetical protein
MYIFDTVHWFCIHLFRLRLYPASAFLIVGIDMEALSGVASGIAVALLTLQLIQSVCVIKAFVYNLKDAAKELERLVTFLGRLEALLEAVRKNMGQQLLLQDQHFPTPSMTIFESLETCKNSLQPLLDISEKFRKPHSQFGSKVAIFKSELRLGLKAKEIDSFEMHIQQEITHLQANLMLNFTAIM